MCASVSVSDVETGNGSERGTCGKSEMAWSDSGAGEADEDVQELRDGAGDL